MYSEMNGIATKGTFQVKFHLYALSKRPEIKQNQTFWSGLKQCVVDITHAITQFQNSSGVGLKIAALDQFIQSVATARYIIFQLPDWIMQLPGHNEIFEYTEYAYFNALEERAKQCAIRDKYATSQTQPNHKPN